MSAVPRITSEDESKRHVQRTPVYASFFLFLLSLSFFCSIVFFLSSPLSFSLLSLFPFFAFSFFPLSPHFRSFFLSFFFLFFLYCLLFFFSFFVFFVEVAKRKNGVDGQHYLARLDPYCGPLENFPRSGSPGVCPVRPRILHLNGRHFIL